MDIIHLHRVFKKEVIDRIVVPAGSEQGWCFLRKCPVVVWLCSTSGVSWLLCKVRSVSTILETLYVLREGRKGVQICSFRLSVKVINRQDLAFKSSNLLLVLGEDCLQSCWFNSHCKSPVAAVWKINC
jgi:hypothetical protein